MIYLTLGDPWSVNVEIIALSLASNPSVTDWGLCLIGSRWHWQQQMEAGLWPHIPMTAVDSLPISGRGVYFYEPKAISSLPKSAIEKQPDQLSLRDRGIIAVAALHALREVTSGQDKVAVVTAPIDKQAVHAAGFDYPGQTEYFADLWGGHGTMLLAGPTLRVALCTIHVPLAQVPSLLSISGIVRDGQALAGWIAHRTAADEKATIAVLGLNPHASDGGLFGDEESRIIAPAVAQLNEWTSSKLPHIRFVGPLSADTAFHHAQQGQYAAVLAMYHDQGLGPLKTVDFDTAINITLGLKHLRVSPDHGPARDLFGQGCASRVSMQHALGEASAYHKRGGGRQ